MAGRERSGYDYSTEDLFFNISYIFTETQNTDKEALNKLSTMALDIGCSDVTITSPEYHDKMIAYTSQLAHVVSNAYVKSPQAQIHKGFSAGSYKDLTRVAKLNENMWAELFLENKEHILFELNYYIESLKSYSDAIAAEDRDALIALLDEGKKRKEQVDG